MIHDFNAGSVRSPSAGAARPEPGEPRSRALAPTSLRPNLPPALSGRRMYFGDGQTRLAGYVSPALAMGSVHAASGAVPLLLIHSVNAAASAAEVRPIYEAHAAHRPVMALELPGFGSSGRPYRHHTPERMTDALLMAVDQIRRVGFKAPLDLLAVSLSCEFAARAALVKPTWFRSVALVNPTGLESARLPRYEDGRSRDKPWLRFLLERGPWNDALFRLLTTEKAMRRFLARAWGSPRIDESLLAYNRITVHQPGARHAPYSFIAGSLFTRGVAHLYQRLTQPVWLAHGTRGEFARFDGLRVLKPHAPWTVDAFDTGAMPYFERPAEFMASHARFLAALPEPASAEAPDTAAQAPASLPIDPWRTA